MASSKNVLRGTLGNTYCGRGHVHPPWNTSGVLRIAKCESICGFCQKETKTAANLRKHVAIHIKNEGLNLTIAEGSSGRGREIPPKELETRRESPTPPLRSNAPLVPNTQTTDFSAPAVLISISNQSSQSYDPPHPIHQMHPPLSQPLVTYFPRHSQSSSSQSLNPSYPPSLSTSSSNTPSPIQTTTPLARFHPQDTYNPAQILNTTPSALDIRTHRHKTDPYHALRTHNLATKSAWTAIPASEGFAILDFCKKNSVLSTSRGSGVIGEEDGGGERERRVPCYNRKILFDEEWQAHMRGVHGVYLLWPETWMRRIEVLDLDPFGGDIGVCNDVIMAN